MPSPRRQGAPVRPGPTHSLSWSWGPPSSWEYGRMHPYLEEAVRASHLPYLLGRLTLLADSRLEWRPGRPGTSVCSVPELRRATREVLPTAGLALGEHDPGRHLTDVRGSGALGRPQGSCSGYSWRGPPPGRIRNPHSNGTTVLPKGTGSEARSREQLCGDRKVTRCSSAALGRPCHLPRGPHDPVRSVLSAPVFTPAN